MNSSSESMVVNGGVLSAALDEAAAESLLIFLVDRIILTGLLASSVVCKAFLFRVRGDVVEEGGEARCWISWMTRPVHELRER